MPFSFTACPITAACRPYASYSNRVTSPPADTVSFVRPCASNTVCVADSTLPAPVNVVFPAAASRDTATPFSRCEPTARPRSSYSVRTPRPAKTSGKITDDDLFTSRESKSSSVAFLGQFIEGLFGDRNPFVVVFFKPFRAIRIVQDLQRCQSGPNRRRFPQRSKTRSGCQRQRHNWLTEPTIVRGRNRMDLAL